MYLNVSPDENGRNVYVFNFVCGVGITCTIVVFIGYAMLYKKPSAFLTIIRLKSDINYLKLLIVYSYNFVLMNREEMLVYITKNHENY